MANRDVRMRGFRDRTVVERAVTWVDEHATPLGHETVELAALWGRVLASSVTAAMDVPPFDRAAMDGYALQGAETQGAGDYNPLAFRIIGTALPGRPFEQVVVAGTAVRIMTGSPMPAGADAVLPAEYAAEVDDTVEITTAVSPGKHVGRLGEDIAADSTVLHAGRRLRPQDVGVLASIGLCQADVVRRPRVRIAVTGDELAIPGQSRNPQQIFEANSVMLAGLVQRDGGQLLGITRCADDRATIQSALVDADADVVLVSGGSSVGREDHAPLILAEVGELPIHGVAMRPSSPAGMGNIGSTLVFLLPGNPVSCLCAYDFFAGRAIRQLGGRSADWPYVARSGKVVGKIVSAIGRVDYCRVAVAGDAVTPIALSGASILSSTSRADGFVVVPAEREGYPGGAEVTVYLYDTI